SDRVAPSILVNTLGGYSVLALYVTVVLAVGRLVRSRFGTQTHRIPYEEMPDATELLEVVDGIHIAQYTKYPGHLRGEAHRYWMLIRIYRSPETLLRVTKRKDE